MVDRDSTTTRKTTVEREECGVWAVRRHIKKEDVPTLVQRPDRDPILMGLVLDV